MQPHTKQSAQKGSAKKKSKEDDEEEDISTNDFEETEQPQPQQQPQPPQQPQRPAQQPQQRGHEDQELDVDDEQVGDVTDGGKDGGKNLNLNENNKGGKKRREAPAAESEPDRKRPKLAEGPEKMS